MTDSDAKFPALTDVPRSLMRIDQRLTKIEAILEADERVRARDDAAEKDRTEKIDARYVALEERVRATETGMAKAVGYAVGAGTIVSVVITAAVELLKHH